MHRNPAAASVPAQNSRVLIITAIITAATTIGVAFIGVFPQLRNSDNKRYEQLQQEFADFRKKAGNDGVVNPPSEKKMSVSGTVFDEAAQKRLAGVEVYLLPEGNNYLTAKTDDNGNFTLSGIPYGVYSIIVRESGGRSGKGLLDDAGDEVKVIGASIRYRIRR
jgi:hypothetical protein